MKEKLAALTYRIISLSLPATAFLIPLFFLPLTVDFFSPHKTLILTFISSLVLLSWAIRSVILRHIRLTLAPATIPLLILTLIYLISAIVQSPNDLIAILGRTSIIFSLIIIYLATTSTLTNIRILTTTFFAFIASLSLSSLIAIISFTGIASGLTALPWLANRAFNPLGGALPFLSLGIPTLITLLYLILKDKTKNKLTLIIPFILIVLGTIISFTLVLPKDGQPQLILLPIDAGWAIAVENLKNIRSILLGTGPESFLTSFNFNKPLSINQGPFWNIHFSTSSNEIFHLLTTVGVIGTLLYLLAFVKTYTISLKSHAETVFFKALKLFFLLLIIGHFLIPATLSFLTISFILLSLLTLGYKLSSHSDLQDVVLSIFAINIVPAAQNQQETTAPTYRNTPVLPLVLLALSLVMIGFHGFFRLRAYAADLVFYGSLIAAAQNDGVKTYNYQIQTISLNPRSPEYRLAYSQTNLALANSLASKTDITDQDRANVTQLIQQAIREAKAATALDPKNAATWANLGNIYRQLINVAQGSDQWAIAAYSQAIALDPLNPELRLELGGLHYALKDYNQAIRLFQQAADAKPDWANVHYNLAAAYKETKNYPLALQSMRVAASLLDATSPDYQKAQDEVTALEKLVSDTSGRNSPQSDGSLPPTSLTTPTPIPSPTTAPIRLPDGSGLDLPAATPSAIPEQ